MIHDHNDKRLGGPNADVIERIEAMSRPKLVQSEAVPEGEIYAIDFPAVAEAMKRGKSLDEALKAHSAKIINIDFGQKRKFL
jgi:hypothetical protein